jgi:hypothetical protein
MGPPPKRRMKRAEESWNRTTLLAYGFIGVLFAAFIVVAWQSGFFTFTGSQPSANVVAAALALTGVFVTAALTAIGVVLKQSVDERTLALQKQAETRLSQEKEHNDAIQDQAERRLQMDTAIRAVQLFSTSTGAMAPEVQVAGALYALGSLNQHKLTLSLVADLLGRNELDTDTAGEVVGLAIRSGDARVQTTAISCLWQNVTKMVNERGASVPECVADGCGSCVSSACSGLPEGMVGWAPLILGKALTAMSADDWRQGEALHNAYWILDSLFNHYHSRIDSEDEESVLVRDISGCLLERAWRAFPEYQAEARAELLPELTAIETPGDAAAKVLAPKLVAWAKAASVQPSE